MSRRKFFILASAALVALAGVASAAGEAETCNEALIDYKFRDSPESIWQYETAGYDGDCTTAGGVPAKQSVYEFTQHYSISCAKPFHIYDVTFALSQGKGADNVTIKANVSVIVRKAITNGDVKKPSSDILYEKEFQQYDIYNEVTNCTFPIEFCTPLIIYLFILFLIIILFYFILFLFID